MILVLFFCTIIILIIIFILFSTIRIQIIKFEISNVKKVNSNYIINISAYLLNKIKWISLKLDEKKIKKISKKIHLEKLNIQKIEKNLKLSDIKEIINIKPLISFLNLDINIGLEDVILTSYLIPIICTILTIILPYISRNKDIKNINYKISPIYNNKKIYNIKIDAIVEIKLINVLNAVYKIYKNGTYYQYKSLKET